MSKNWIYAAVIDGRISAFHEKKKLIREYCTNYKASNPRESIQMIRIKEKKAEALPNFDAYYLEDWGGGLIQSKYVEVMQIDDNGDVVLCDRLKSQLEQLLLKNLSSKQKKSVLGVIEIINMKEKNHMTSTPSLKYLSHRYWMIEEYKNHTCEKERIK